MTYMAAATDLTCPPSTDFEDLNRLCLAVEESQRIRLKLAESITAANLCFIETGSISRMAAVIAETCMKITGSRLCMIAETMPGGTISIISLVVAPSDQLGHETGFCDIQYEILRHGCFELHRHDSLFFETLKDCAPFFWNNSEAVAWPTCSCPVCTPRLENFAGIPLVIGSTVTGAIYLANHSTETMRERLQELEGHAQTCALALAGARADLERKLAREQLRQAQKMEAIGQLAGGIAHDFNNLLTVINGYSTLLLQKVGDNDAARRDVEQILGAGERATTLIRQLLAFSRRQILDLQLLNVNSLIASLHKFLCRLIGENITLTTRLSPELGMIRADAGQIEQIIMNLVINARDAMENGGSIFIETADKTIDAGFIRFNPGAIAGDYVMIAVRDTGMGMSPEIINRIFEPFFTTKEQGTGTGLGLATVYGIVKQSNGYIQVLSEVGLGSEFRVYLPLTSQGEAANLSSQDWKRPLDVHPGETGLVLVVEDERTVLDLAAITLRSCGFDVLTASGPLEALKIFERYAGKIDLLLTDVMMPDMSGVELANLLKLNKPELNVIFMSGYTDDHLKGAHFPVKSGDFVMKPFNPVSLARIIRERISPPSASASENHP